MRVVCTDRRFGVVRDCGWSSRAAVRGVGSDWDVAKGAVERVEGVAVVAGEDVEELRRDGWDIEEVEAVGGAEVGVFFFFFFSCQVRPSSVFSRKVDELEWKIWEEDGYYARSTLEVRHQCLEEDA